MKKKIKIIVVIIIILALIGGTVGYFLTHEKKEDDSGEYVYVDTVSNIMGLGYSVDSRYMGVVEAQETKTVNPDSDKKVKELLVSEGDTVKEGDPLFEYDTEEMNLKLKQLELELQSINNNISTLNTQIAELVSERDAAPAENKIEYTSQIQNLQAQVNQNNYDASAKQLEIDRQSAAMENNVVTSPMDGIVKKINESAATSGENGYGDEYGYSQSSSSDDNAYISIMAMGDYRIKGTASELNVRSMSKGDPVIVHSRLDETLTWSGTISEIDLEHTESNNNNYYYFDGGSSESTSNYPFYVDLENLDGLILGEHVYIELDYGQGVVKDGVWLSEFYIATNDDGSNYVWIENSKGKIEKRIVTLGDYDEDLFAYEITSGLTNDDYIAFPEERIKEGMKTTRNYEDVMVYEDWYDDDEQIMYFDDLDPDTIIYDDEDDTWDEDFNFDEDMMQEEDFDNGEDMMQEEEFDSSEDVSGEDTDDASDLSEEAE